MSRPRLLDLFCGAGGAAKGYQRSGFYVVGVDIKAQPHYCGDEFYQADALEYVSAHGQEFDAIHASPPCQRYTTGAKAAKREGTHPDLYGVTRDCLETIGLPWIIENVIGAPYRYGIMLCGSMFDLRIQRHRNFETSFLILSPFTCRHRERPITITTATDTGSRGIVDYKHSRQAPFLVNREVMQMPWVETQEEIGLAIPPVYTEYIGRQLIRYLAGKVTVKE